MKRYSIQRYRIGVGGSVIVPIIDWGGFSSWCLIPTLMLGKGTISYGGWLYIYWLQGRFGFRWSPKDDN